MKPSVWLLFFVSSAAAHELTARGAPDRTQLEEYLTRKKSPLAAGAAQFEEHGTRWNVDSRLVVSIAGAETTFGKHLCASNNAWNWFHRRSCPPSVFSSYDEGIRTVTKFMQRSYLRKGYTTIPAIRRKYCAAGCENWIPLVTRFRAEMPAGKLPDPQPPQQPAPAPPPFTSRQFMGVPLYVLFFGGAALVLVWLLRQK